MKKTQSLMLAVVLVGVALSGWFMANGQAADKVAAPASSSAVVDIVKVFNEYERTQKINAQLTRRQEDLQNQRKAKLDQIEALKAELENFHPDSKDYYQRQKDLLKNSIELETFTRVTAEEIKREFRVQTEDIYNEILAAVKAVAENDGYDMVFFMDKVQITGESFPALLEKIRERKVLYSSPKLDITADVLDQINQTYKMKNAK